MNGTMKYTINMRSAADKVKGQGVGSAYEEQVELVRSGLADRFEVLVNGRRPGDITHYHTLNPTFFMEIPFAKAKGVTVGYVHFLPETVDQSLRMPKPLRKLFYRYMLTFYKRMDYLVTVNPYFIGRLAAYGVDPGKVVYIPNFVNEQDFFPIDGAGKRALRQEYGLDPDRFTVVCAGQLQTRKGVFDFAACARRLPEVQFVWAGGFSFGKMTDGYEDIRKLMENPPENLHFTGIVARERMNGIYNLGDVMFLPSYEELFPMTILEAMNARIPLLLRDIPIYENILFDYYQRATDNDGFVALLERLRTDPAFYRKAQGESGRGHQFYNREHVLSMWDSFYTGLAAQENPLPSPSPLRHLIG